MHKNNSDNNIDKEIYYTNRWAKPILIHFYEMNIINIDQFSNGFNDIILDIYDINNKSLDSSINNNRTNINKKKKIWNYLPYYH